MLAAGLLVVLAGCGRGAEEADRQERQVLVRVEQVRAGEFVQKLELTGTVEPTVVAALSSPAEGPVVEVGVREGDQVRQGQELVRIGRMESVEAELVSAEESLTTQENAYARVESLYADKALSAEEYDRARAELERVRSQVSRARQAARDFQIRAPWDGVVSRLHVAQGRYVAPRMALVDVFDPTSLVLRFQVPERYVFAVELEQRLQAQFDAMVGSEYALQVVRAWAELDRRMRSRTFEAALPDGGGDFVPGQFARLQLTLNKVEGALTVPAYAVLDQADGSRAVFVVDADQKARLRKLTISGESGGRSWVVEGLTEGDRVVVQGQTNLKPGQIVRIAEGQVQ